MQLNKFGLNNKIWDDLMKQNENIDIIQNALTGALSKDVSGQEDVELSEMEATNGLLVFTGTLTDNVTVIVPNVPRVYHVQNQTSGDHTLTLKTGAGTGVPIQQASLPNYPRIKRVLCDGSNIVWADGSQIVEDNLHEATPTQGYYVRFADGVQVCYKNVVATVDVNVTFGSLFRSSSAIQLGQFAQPFLTGTRPSINLSLTGGTNFGIPTILTGVSNTGMGGVSIANATSVTDVTYTVSVTAIGRWK